MYNELRQTVPVDCAPLSAVRVPEKGAVLQDGKFDDNELPDGGAVDFVDWCAREYIGVSVGDRRNRWWDMSGFQAWLLPQLHDG